MKLLIERPAKNDAGARNYGSALQAVAGYGHSEVVELLLGDSANISRPSSLVNEELGYLASLQTPCPVQRDKCPTHFVVDVLDEVSEGGPSCHTSLFARLRRLCWTDGRRQRRTYTRIWKPSPARRENVTPTRPTLALSEKKEVMSSASAAFV